MGIIFIVISCNNGLINKQMQKELKINASKSLSLNKKENKNNDKNKFQNIEKSKKFVIKKFIKNSISLNKLIKTNWKENLNKLSKNNDIDSNDDGDLNIYTTLIKNLTDKELIIYTQDILYTNIKYLNNLPYELLDIIMYEYISRLSKDEDISNDEKKDESENIEFVGDDLRSNHDLILKFINKEYDYILDPYKVIIRTLFDLNKGDSAYDELCKQKEKDSKTHDEAFYIIKRAYHYSVLYYNFKEKIIYHLDSTGNHSGSNFVYSMLSKKPEIIGGFSYLCLRNVEIKQQDKGNGCYLFAYLNALILGKITQTGKLLPYLNNIINKERKMLNSKRRKNRARKNEIIIKTNIDDLPMGTEILIRNIEMGKLVKNNFEDILNKIPGGLVWSCKKQKKFVTE